MATSDDSPAPQEQTTAVAIMVGGPLVLLFAIYVFIQRVGTKPSRPDS